MDSQGFAPKPGVAPGLATRCGDLPLVPRLVNMRFSSTCRKYGAALAREHSWRETAPNSHLNFTIFTGAREKDWWPDVLGKRFAACGAPHTPVHSRGPSSFVHSQKTQERQNPRTWGAPPLAAAEVHLAAPGRRSNTLARLPQRSGLSQDELVRRYMDISLVKISLHLFFFSQSVRIPD